MRRACVMARVSNIQLDYTLTNLLAHVMRTRRNRMVKTFEGVLIVIGACRGPTFDHVDVAYVSQSATLSVSYSHTLHVMSVMARGHKAFVKTPHCVLPTNYPTATLLVESRSGGGVPPPHASWITRIFFCVLWFSGFSA